MQVLRGCSLEMKNFITLQLTEMELRAAAQKCPERGETKPTWEPRKYIICPSVICLRNKICSQDETNILDGVSGHITHFLRQRR